MTRRYNNLAEKEVLNDALEFAKTNEIKAEFSNSNQCSQIAKECLQVVSSKWVATQLAVTPRVVQAWASGEKAIPMDRGLQILLVTKGYFLDVSRIEDAVDRMLMSIYGPADKGRF